MLYHSILDLTDNQILLLKMLN